MKITSFREDIDQVYKNDFKDNNIYPFNQIRRVLVDSPSGAILSELDPMDSRYRADGTYINLINDILYNNKRYEWMTYIPVFAYKREWDGDTLIDKVSTKVPTSIEENGYRIHPMFLKEDGTFAPYILYGCFPNVALNNGLLSLPIGAYRAELGGVAPPSYGLNLENQRYYIKYLRQDPTRWSVETIMAWSGIQMLFKIAFGTLNVQKVIGEGSTNYTQYHCGGATVSIGDRSGSVYRNFYDVQDNIVLSKCSSIFGIEDFYGGHFRMVDGIYGLNNMWLIASYTDMDFSSWFSNIYQDPRTLIVHKPSVLGGARHIKGISKFDGFLDFLNVPGDSEELTENREDTYYCDTWWGLDESSTNYSNFCIIAVGGGRNNTTNCGLFTFSDMYAYTSSGYFTTRTLFIP